MIELILLAAGLSRRFGSNKLLASWAGRPLYTYSLEALAGLAAGRQDCALTVVTCYEEIRRAALEAGARVCWNDHSADGITSSLRLGLEAAPEARFYLCSVADQPGLTAELAGAFLEAFLASGRPLGCVSHGGVPGNPAIFHRRFRPELLALEGDRGGRRVLERHREERFLWPGPALPDVDTPADLAAQAAE